MPQEDYERFQDDDDLALEDVSAEEPIEPEPEEEPFGSAHGERPPEPVAKPALSETEGDDKEPYSKRVQKRIDKLAYERNIERDRVSRLEAEIEELKAHRQQELAAITNQETDAQRKDLIQQKRDALEIGDYDCVVDLDEQLFDLRVKTEPPQPNQPSQQQRPVEPPQPGSPQAMVDWEANNKWVYDAANQARLDKANTLLKELTSAGYDLDEPETYVELDRKLKRVIPPPSGAPDRGQLTGGNKDTAFTGKDKQTMRDWGLDPDNAKHRAEWIKNRSKS